MHRSTVASKWASVLRLDEPINKSTSVFIALCKCPGF
jgi:hypothetical protein